LSSGSGNFCLLAMGKSSDIRTFVIGDIHGAYKAMEQCFEKANFDINNDELICLGDVCDGWPEVWECYHLLMQVKNLTLLLGNHDEFTMHWLTEGYENPAWLAQGGEATKKSLLPHINKDFLAFFNTAKPYHIKNNRLFVHAGCNPNKPIKKNTIEELVWDRNLVNAALLYKKETAETKLTPFDTVFVGHTPTIRYGSDKPIKAADIWMLDTGAGWDGKLTMMEINTGEIFQSNQVTTLYPGVKGRL